MQKSLITSLFVITSFSTPLYAQLAPYLGLSLGETQTHYTNDMLGLQSADIRNYTFGGRGYAGLQFTKELAIESGAWFLRPTRVYDIQISGQNARIQQYLFDLLIRADWPLANHYHAVGRFGVAYYTAKPDALLQSLSTTDYHNSSVAHFRPEFGLGVRYVLDAHFNLEADWMHVLEHRALPDLNAVLIGIGYSWRGW